MNDREFLMWIHERLEHVHGENAYVDYMHKLRAIIQHTSEDQRSLNVGSWNTLKQLKEFLKNDGE